MSEVITPKTAESAFTQMRRLSPKVTGGLVRMREESYKDGVAPGKYKVLTALAISVAIRCEPCIDGYAKQAVERDVSREELLEFLNVAMTMQGCPGEEWAIKALQAFNKHKERDSANSKEESCCS
ncbi:carboxymuconolactone decarboxylase family protein [candidate division KSB1 bacterium]|nr:carboxymuconolactone decarboxylase family protein [candidate division KSB1 bacterium]NIR70819.1 carboxymuconolactone decarboxylase family protein [candidate division KSB1 bacterium]NIS27831.1 carboxymuconolactone decarboxylase family protein [candidate division KSB1 bacterium]NIT74713.1 carboxymuconolactone decarboxylase family protein [candidate division KSB1 bacterium]NIU28496.1 carboxymuconolactone decarboxylase family protein [candidate division KSB1 bacterium]